MASRSFDTHHEDLIHDAQLDYYGKRLATASSDRTIKIFEIDDNTQTQTAELKGHDGPVWQVAWAHPKFGSVLASAGYDRKVIIWREGNKNEWHNVFEWKKHKLSVNSIQWAPHEFGTLILAVGSSDGYVSIISQKSDGGAAQAGRPYGERFDLEHPTAYFQADPCGVNAISWAPAISPGALVRSTGSVAPVKRLVVGGCSEGNNLKIWAAAEDGSYQKEEDLVGGHDDWVRDVAWAPSIGLPSSTIASCSQDGSVYVWTKADPNTPWVKRELSKKQQQVVAWKVSWSIAGNILAVSKSDNKVTLWKESADGERWDIISELDSDQAH